MGAWGYAATENDTAGDWLFTHIVPSLRKTILSDTSDPHEALAALDVVVKLDLLPWFKPDEINAVLAKVRADDERSGWREPAKRKAYLRSLERKIAKGGGKAWSPIGTILAGPPRGRRKKRKIK